MSTRDALLASQRRWANANRLTVDERGYLPSYGANLWRPLSATALGCYHCGSGSELRAGKSRPAKMSALHSSSALVANVFDYWCGRDAAPLYEVLGLGVAEEHPRFEAQFPTGLDGNPPNLDVAVRLRSGITLAIESKFCEWLTPKSAAKLPFKEKYFSPVPNLWARAGLPHSQRLAGAIQAKAEQFRHLDAPQLLKHALGLGTNLKDQFVLWYLWYDWPSPESEKHRAEIERFASQTGGELRFRAFTYQEFFRALTQRCGGEHADYLEYLRGRYFEDAA